MAAALLLVVLAGCGGAGSGTGSVAPAALAPPPTDLEVLGEADLGWSVRTLDGEVVRLEELRGRPLFVNVWATWCPPCVAELGSIRALMDALEGSDVAFLLVSPEDVGTVAPFVEGLGYPLPVAVEHTRMPGSWGVAALPTTVVVDRAGRIVLRHRGAADWSQEAVRAFLASLGES